MTSENVAIMSKESICHQLPFHIRFRIFDIFVDTLAKTMEKELRIGDGFDPNSTQGPLINQRAVEKVH
jgi:acyl-CoA reductase-like NAD-dependent aldehyde dehydrogenase